MKKLLAVLVIAFALTGCKHKNPSVFRIGKPDRPHCSAFAISDKFAITAKHCVVQMIELPFGLGTLMTDETYPISVFNEKGEVVKKDLTVRINKRVPMDIAAIEGDFKDYEHLHVDVHSVRITERDRYESCGYPFMTPNLVCNPVTPVAPMVMAYAGTGFLIFGMSGGPVVNISSGNVVGVNSAIGEGLILFTPIVALDVLLGIK